MEFKNEELAQISKGATTLQCSIYFTKSWKGLFKGYENYVPFKVIYI